MKKIIINDSQRGLLYKNGKFIKILDSGKYFTYGGREIEVADIDREILTGKCPVSTILGDSVAKDAVCTVDVSDRELVLHFTDGKFRSLLRSGRHAFWKAAGEHTFMRVDASTPEVSEDVPRYVFSKIPSLYYSRFDVCEYQKARLFYNGKFVRLLEPGTYFFWKSDTEVNVEYVDTRLTQLNVSGQEMLTLDKVSVRVNFVCSYRITDCVKVGTEVDSCEEQLHTAAQLALREYVGKYRLDDILENKCEMTGFVLGALREKQSSLYVEITDAGVKDIILPGEIREIMNTVLVAEKRAQANVISRREEVASTRSLLNTAKLMEENPTLYRLKELEYIERICGNVGNINIGSGADVLGQLAGILGADGRKGAT